MSDGREAFTGRHLWASLWFNYPDDAVSGFPDLGAHPHAEIAMKALGISYLRAVPHSTCDGWAFYHCSGVPDIIPKWLTPHTLTDHWADALVLPREDLTYD